MGIIQGEIDIYGVLESLDKMPQQRQFISASQPNAAYVGGQGSGKSIALCATAILNAIDDPNGYSLIGRLNMPALETTTMKTFLELVPEGMGGWLASKKMFRFSNGHEVIFRHLDITEPKIEGHIKSLNLSAAYVDEATEISQDVYNLLIGRIRRKTAKRRIMRLASNPAGHDWVWRHFFDPKRKPELLSTNLGITASTMDDPGNWTPSGELRGTKFGISAHSFPDVDIEALTLNEAEELYRKVWGMFAELEDQRVLTKVLDLAVNMQWAGHGPATRILQQAVIVCGGNLLVDGAFGARTAEEANKIDSSWLLDSICAQARAHYREIEAAHPEMKTWFATWNKRAEWIPPEPAEAAAISK